MVLSFYTDLPSTKWNESKRIRTITQRSSWSHAIKKQKVNPCHKYRRYFKWDEQQTTEDWISATWCII